MVRQGQLSKLQTVLESGAGESGWRRQRYRDWLSRKTDFYRAREGDAPTELEVAPLAPKPGAQNRTARSRSAIVEPKVPRNGVALEGVIEIDEDVDPADILSQLNHK